MNSYDCLEYYIICSSVIMSRAGPCAYAYTYLQVQTSIGRYTYNIVLSFIKICRGLLVRIFLVTRQTIVLRTSYVDYVNGAESTRSMSIDTIDGYTIII